MNPGKYSDPILGAFGFVLLAVCIPVWHFELVSGGYSILITIGLVLVALLTFFFILLRHRWGKVLLFVLLAGFIGLIALSGPQDHSLRAKMSEPLSLASSMKVVVDSYHAKHSSWPSTIESLSGETNPGPFADTISITNGVIRVDVQSYLGLAGSELP
jgi:thiol:disulfide interchange protein